MDRTTNFAGVLSRRAEGAFGPVGLDIQGHRGARGLLPENTVPGFIRALEIGATTLEMDVVITRDEVVVVSHDAWFSDAFCADPSGTRIGRLAQFRHRLFDLTYEESRAYDCGLPNKAFPEQHASRAEKPRLVDVVAAAERFAASARERPVYYNIETKSAPEGDGLLHPPPDRFVGLLLEVLQETDVISRSTIQSFDPRTLRMVWTTDVRVGTSLLVERMAHLGVEADLEILGFVPHVYSPDYRLVDETLVRRAHQYGMRVIPWTINDPNLMRRVIDLGVDGLITDYPDRAVSLLGMDASTAHRPAS